MSWVLENLVLIGSLAAVHLRQCAISLILGFICSVPLGWLAWRYSGLRTLLLTATGLLYTIPSLALLLILPAILGFSVASEVNLIAALTIYAIAIMVRAVADGLASVDHGTRQAATAVGFGELRRVITVDLPLAGPVILSGVRVAAVSTISLATVGILVGVTNLGYLFTNGLQRRIIAEVAAGVLAVVVIALIIDAVLVLLGRLLMPWASSSPAHRGARDVAPGGSAL